MYKKTLSLAVAACLVFMAAPLIEGAQEPDMEDGTERTVTFARCLPDGTVEQVRETVHVAAGEELSSAIAERCTTLLMEDARFQQVMEQQLGLYLIVSGGDGFHMALPPALLEIPLMRLSFNLLPSIIYCSYSDDEASTTITSLTGGDGITSYDGPHKVLAAGFVGVIGWSGVFSFQSTGYAGLTLYAWASTGS